MARDQKPAGPTSPDGSWSDWIVFVFGWGLIRLVLALPYRMRLGVMAWVLRRVVGPIAGYRSRAEANLAYIWPTCRNRTAAIWPIVYWQIPDGP